ncbi:PAS domain-containing protein [uncultured Cohaesibacter sp.]|uniref:PAS domain-containing protein n=1 Tax=uncultured Cohaesibacter sp. TaxID=1002546 RepID=UPI0029C91539|nr:PAS domain-containing protein [uncultured Cohaesibacter sp.]
MPDKHYLQRELEERIESDPGIWDFIRSASLDGVWYWDLENIEQEWMSPEFWTLFGYDPKTKKHLASEWQDIIFAEDLETAKANLYQHLEDPNHPYDQIVRYRHAAGHTVWVRCRGLAIRDESGKPTRLLGAHNDLTEQMSIRDRLADSNNLLAAVLNSVQSGVVGLLPDRRIAFINAAARDILGGRTEAVPFAWPDDIHFLDRESFQPIDEAHNPVERALAGKTLTGETHILACASQPQNRYVRLSSSSVENESARVQSVLVIDDVTSQEVSRQQVERSSRLDALGQLTGGIAHDFNNLLATMQYAVQLAQHQELPEKADKYLKTALSSIDRGTALTHRLLAFAKRQPGQAKASRVRTIIDEFSELARPTIEEHINLTFEINDPNLWVYCDISQLENALLNLFLNSRDAIIRSGKGSHISIVVRSVAEVDADVGIKLDNPDSYKARGMSEDQAADKARNDNRARRYVEFAITDNGPGMSEEVKRRSIDPFFTTKETNSGTGLGLSMVYGFIQQSDGEMRIYSEEGMGTTVRLLIPRGTVEGKREDPVERLPKAMGSGEAVMIVEDEANLLTMMKDIVETLGYRVFTARSGQQALDLLKAEQSVRVVLTDIVMPGEISGFDLAKRVVASNPHCKIIYMSGYTGFTTDEMGDAVAPMISKPATPTELGLALAEALSSN